MSVPKIKRVTKQIVTQFVIEFEGQLTGPDVIGFHPVDNCPGFTHRVSINKQATREWLAAPHKPTAKAARFFWGKIRTAQLKK